MDHFDMRKLEAFFDSLRQRALSALTSAGAAVHGMQHRPQPVRSQQTTKPGSAAGVPPKAVAVEDFKNFSRVSYVGYSGRSYVIKNFAKFRGHAIQMNPEVEVRGPNQDLGDGFRNECAALVQYFGVPTTSTWRRGPRVCDFKPGELRVGTVVATLRDGKYYNDRTGRSHVGVYVNHTDYQVYLDSKDQSGSVTLLDQFKGSPIGEHLYDYRVEADDPGKKAPHEWTDKHGTAHTHRVLWHKDGDEYYVLLTDR